MSFRIASLLMSGIAGFSPLLMGATLQVSEDSYATGALEMNAATGKAGKLEISPKCPAYLRFDAGDFAGQIPSADVTAARLTFYIAQNKTAGKLAVHRVTSEWTENPSGKRRTPSISEKPLATLPAASLRAGQFAVIDVTEQVRQWLSSPEKDFGLAIVGDGKAVFVIPSKEGPENGPSATLEIDHQPRVDDAWIVKGVNAAKLGNGSVNNTEFSTLDGVTSPVQGQLNRLTNNLAKVKESADSLERELDQTNFETSWLTDKIETFGSLLAEQDDSIDSLTKSLTGKVGKAGDTMTGTLRLPADGLKVGTNQLAVTGGKVGIGTDAPSAALEVRGDVKLGAAGNFQAVAGEESLRIVRGTILFKDGVLSLVAGSGFTFTLSGSNDADITFSEPFASVPTITFQQEFVSETKAVMAACGLLNVTKTGATFLDILIPGNSVHFIAVGPR